eukprot:g5253.t1
MIKLLFPQIILGPALIFYYWFDDEIVVSVIVVLMAVALTTQRLRRKISYEKSDGEPILRRVGIIGAGPSGLVAAKILKEKGIDVLIFEKMEQIGGAFRYRAYDNAEQVSSKFITSFSDFRFDEKDEDHVSLKDYCKYLERYCDHFDLWKHIQFSKTVRRVTLRGDEKYAVELEQDRKTHIFDAVLVCSGLHLHENIPRIRNFHTYFKGQSFHSATYRNVSNPVSLSRRNIIVVGSGETGLDIAQQALEAGGNVSVSTRSGWLSVPKQLPNGVPLDIYITNMFEASFEHRWVDRSRLKWIVATFFIRLFFFLGTGTSKGFDQWVGTKDTIKRGYHFVNKQAGPMPQINRSHRKGPSARIPRFWMSLKRNLFGKKKKAAEMKMLNRYYCQHPGSIRVVPEIIDTTKTHFLCKDGSKLEFQNDDVIVFATGYLQRFPFLPNRSKTETGEHVLPNRRGICSDEEPRLGFIGFARPNVGAIPPISELQVYWWLENLKKKNKTLRPPTYKLLSTCHKAQTYGVDYGLQERGKLLETCETELWGALKRRGMGSNLMFLWITIQFGLVNLVCFIIDLVLRYCLGIYIE